MQQNQLVICPNAFVFEGMNNVRTLVDPDKNVWFVAKDVAVALGYSEPTNAVRQHCDEGVAKYTPLQTAGGMQEVRIIDESDMYALVFGSKLESAKRFKKWVTSEVLPSIRKTGGYSFTAVPPQPTAPLRVSVTLLDGLPAHQHAQMMQWIDDIAKIAEGYDKAHNALLSQFRRDFNTPGFRGIQGSLDFALVTSYFVTQRCHFEQGYIPPYKGDFYDYQKALH